MSDAIHVTHIANCIPASGLVDPIDIIYQQSRDSDIYFVRGMEGRPFSLRELEAQVEEGELIALKEPIRIDSDESLFLFEDGRVVKAKSEVGPFEDPNKLAVDLGLRDQKGLPMTRMRQLGWLLNYGVRTNDILASDLPSELDGALRELQERDLSELGPHPENYFASFAYPEEICGGLKSVRDRIKAELESHLESPLRNHPKATYDLVTQGFPATPTFLLFPFFWRRGVKDFWGVLRYAQQTKMGIIASQYHPGYSSDIETNYGPGCELNRDVVIEAFLANDSTKGFFYSFTGYVFDEIATVLLRDLGRADSSYSDSVDNYQSKTRPRPKSKDSDDLHEMLSFLSEARGDNDDNSNSIVLVDPGESAEILRRLVDPKFSTIRYLTFRHEKDVPVGFGFSNSALPMILRDGLWRQILNSIDDEFSKLPSNVIRQLASVGLELDPRVMPKTYANCEDRSSFYNEQYTH